MKTTRSKLLISRALLGAALALSSLTAFAYIDIPNPAPVVDLTGSLSDQQKLALTAKIQDLDARTNSEVEMLLLPSTDGENIQSYSWRVAEAWRPGHQGVNRGLVVVVARNDHHSYIQVGHGLSSIINSDVATSLAKNMSPFFRQGDFYGGLNQDLDDVASLIATSAPPAPEANQAQDSAQLNGAPVTQQPADAAPAAVNTVPPVVIQQAPETGKAFPILATGFFGLCAVIILFALFRMVSMRQKAKKRAAALYPTRSTATNSSGFRSASTSASTSKPASTSSSSAASPSTTGASTGASTSRPVTSAPTTSTPRTSNDALFGSDFTRTPRTPAPDPRRASAPDARRTSTPDPRRSSLSSTNMRGSSSSSSSVRQTSSSGSRSNSDDSFTAGYVAGSLSSTSRTTDSFSRSDDSSPVSWSAPDTGGTFDGTGGGTSWDNS